MKKAQSYFLNKKKKKKVEGGPITPQGPVSQLENTELFLGRAILTGDVWIFFFWLLFIVSSADYILSF